MIKPDRAFWKRLLCAVTFHAWRPVFYADFLVDRCTFCGEERAR